MLEENLPLAAEIAASRRRLLQATWFIHELAGHRHLAGSPDRFALVAQMRDILKELSILFDDGDFLGVVDQLVELAVRAHDVALSKLKKIGVDGTSLDFIG